MLRILPEMERKKKTRLITLSLEKCVNDKWMDKFIAKERKGGRDRPCAEVIWRCFKEINSSGSFSGMEMFTQDKRRKRAGQATSTQEKSSGSYAGNGGARVGDDVHTIALLTLRWSRPQMIAAVHLRLCHHHTTTPLHLSHARQYINIALSCMDFRYQDYHKGLHFRPH